MLVDHDFQAAVIAYGKDHGMNDWAICYALFNSQSLKGRKELVSLMD
jgi:hypothetical protein